MTGAQFMRQVFALLGVGCILAATLHLDAVQAAAKDDSAKVSVVAQKSDGGAAAPAAEPATFRPSAGDYSGRIAGSLGFVLLVALAGVATVYVMKRKVGFVSKTNVTQDYGARLLSFKRIGPRLNVLVIDVGRGKVVTLADNGNSLIKLAEFDRSESASIVEAVSKKSDEK